jgi:nucleoside-diphosphate kinase
MEKTLVIIKPDAVQRGLIGEVTKRLEQKGLKLMGMKMMYLDDETLKEHYSHIADKPFFPGIAKFMKSSPAIFQVWSGLDVVNAVRILAGITKAREADSGSIRGDLAMSIQCNVIHASDSVEAGESEVKRFFAEDELHDYDKSEWVHVYAEDERRDLGYE